MYEAFFRLKRKPFELVPDPEFIYLSRSHKKAITYLDYGIRERAGFILLTGDVGSGKTTLICDLLNKRYEHVVVSKIFNTRVTSDQLLAMINDDFGITATGRDKVTLVRDLNDFLLKQYAAGLQPVLIIDEAQNLPADLLEEVRMLSNLESSHSKLLQIVLVGQPELRRTLAAPQLMQLRQRISINCHLKPLTREETEAYITHRMEVAGNRSALEFPAETLDLVFRYSRGIPRLINVICDFLMLSAFAEEARSVSAEMVRDVVGDLDFDQHFWGSSAAPVQGEQTLSPESEAVFDEILNEIRAVQREVSERLPSALKVVGENLALLKAQLDTHVDETETRLQELRAKLETVTRDSERDDGSGGGRGTKGLVNRLLGGIAYSEK